MPRVICPSCNQPIGNRNGRGEIVIKTRLLRTAEDGVSLILDCPKCRETVSPRYDTESFSLKLSAQSVDRRPA